jgi:hypothetical protein
MSEKTTLEIGIAVSECQPLTEEELRLGMHAMVTIEHFVRRSLKDVVDAIQQDKPAAIIKMKAELAKQTMESMFQARKRPPKEWLGPSDTPGTPEQREGLRLAKAIVKKATGLDL